MCSDQNHTLSRYSRLYLPFQAELFLGLILSEILRAHFSQFQYIQPKKIMMEHPHQIYELENELLKKKML